MRCPDCQAEIPEGRCACSCCGRALPDASTGPEPAGRAGGSTENQARIFAGRYRMLWELGRGGMGVVVLAEDTRLKRAVALKFLSAELAAERKARDRFLREAQAAAVIDNPHVCTIYEAGEADGCAFIAMALVDGTSLKQLIAKGPLPIADALRIACQVAEGLAAAHARSVVHRDIKPGNILLARDGQAKITDFGLARIEGAGDTTRTGVVVGTLLYMSPEQAQGQRTDHRTDIWSFGCILYEMLTGRAPYSGREGGAVLYGILHETPNPVTASRPETPPQLAAIIERCLQKEPQRRYSEASKLLDDLRAAAAAAMPASAGTGGAGPPSVAVLPFADMSAERNQEYFAEGIAEELIHALARIRGLRVVARTSAFALKGKNLDVREIGRVLNVSAVLEGSVRSDGRRLRITAQLINVEDGYHLWSERFDRDAGDIFAIQDELAQSIVAHLKVSLHVDEAAALQKRTTDDADAYNLYLKGRYFIARPRPDSLQAALRFFRLALDRDPSFAGAWAGIANGYGAMGNLNFAPATEAWPKAKAAIEKALALDGSLAEAHSLAAAVAFWFDWDWAAAGAGFRRCLALSPGDAFAHGNYAWFLLNRRSHEESLAEIRRAISLDPLMPLLYAWSIALHSAAGRLDEALAEFARAMEIDPAFGLPYFHAGVAYMRRGELDRAVETLERGSRIAAHPGWAEAIMVVIRLRQGNREAAARLLADMIEQKRRINVSSVAIAWASAALGDSDDAFRWFELGFAEKDSLMVFVHVYTPMLARELAEDPRFATLLEKLNLADVAG